MRHYFLDGVEIPSSAVEGFLHTAKENKRDVCGACLKPITKGQEYIVLNRPNSYIFHKDHYLGDAFAAGCDIILGVATTAYQLCLGAPKRKGAKVICKKFVGTEVKTSGIV